MTEQYLAPYDLLQHAAKTTPQYPGTHVVENGIPLSEITFDPRDDEMVRYRGPRHAHTCPQIDVLEAVASNPQILGFEERQHLTVKCQERVQVIDVDGVTSYGICALKAAGFGVDLESIPSRALTDPLYETDLHCAFEYLGGSVVAEEVRVPLAVDARESGQQREYQAI